MVVKVGLSYTGVEGARKNLTAETADSYDFDATRATLQQAWLDKLTAIGISGGTNGSANRVLHRALPLAPAPEPRR